MFFNFLLNTFTSSFTHEFGSKSCLDGTLITIKFVWLCFFTKLLIWWRPLSSHFSLRPVYLPTQQRRPLLLVFLWSCEPCPRAMFGSSCNVTQSRLPSDVECRGTVLSCDDWPFGGGWKIKGGFGPSFHKGCYCQCVTLLTRLPAFTPSTSGSPRPTWPTQWRLRQTTTSERLGGRREYAHG